MHPFRVRRSATDTAHWIDAGDLVAGEQIETQSGHWAAVQSVTPVKGLATVYNFTVEEDHDYFVGDEGLLVHNGEGITAQGIQDIIDHLSRPELFDPDTGMTAAQWPPNQEMIQRLQNGETTPWDQSFYEHELMEKGLMDQNPDLSPRDAHSMTLQRQGIPETPGYQKEIYHPDVIKNNPEYFNPACR